MGVGVAAPSNETLLRGVVIVDPAVTGSPRNADVLVRDGKIVAITAAGKSAAGAQVIEGNGRFLIPGLSEMHAHVPPPEKQRALAEDYLRLYVANGVTSIRGMLGAPWHIALRSEIASGKVLGPRFFAGAPSLNGDTAPDVATAVRLVREYQAAGFDFLKLHPGLKREVFDAIVTTSREVHIEFAGHVSEAVGIEHALEARQSAVDHLDGYLEGMVDPECRGQRDGGFFGVELVDCMNPARIAPLVELTLASGTWNIATQTLLDKFVAPPANDAEALRRRPEMKYMAPTTAQNWMRALANWGRDSVAPEKAQRFIELRRQLLRSLYEAGAPLMIGSDSPQVFNVPGFATHDELGAFVRAGIPPRAALQAATLGPARFFGHEREFGSIEVGKAADLVLLEANPLDAIDNTRRIAGVMLRGRWLSRADLDRMLGEVATRAAKR
jgi:imidazolonepropionase-like amidohydrolase